MHWFPAFRWVEIYDNYKAGNQSYRLHIESVISRVSSCLHTGVQKSVLAKLWWGSRNWCLINHRFEMYTHKYCKFKHYSFIIHFPFFSYLFYLTSMRHLTKFRTLSLRAMRLICEHFFFKVIIENRKVKPCNVSSIKILCVEWNIPVKVANQN